MPQMQVPTAVTRTLTLAAATAALTLPTLVAHAEDAVQWRVEDGGNGHWYAARQYTPEEDPEGNDRWYLAKDICESLGGHLTTLTSSSESDFVWSTVVPTIPSQSGPGAGPMLGGWKIDGTWGWVTGETWSYTLWCGSEPTGDGPLLQIWTFGNPCWNDFPGNASRSYLIEWSADCNGDGIVDYGQILDGSFRDDDGNGVPDCCDEGSPCVSQGQSDIDLVDPKIALGGSFGIAITVDGRVITWGSDHVADVPEIIDPVAVAAGFGGHALALQADGTMVAWGANSYGQTNVPGGLDGVVAIEALSRGTLALRADGSVTGWGDDYWCGAGTTSLDFPSGVEISEINGGNAHWLYRRASDGHVIGRGCNFNGQWNVPGFAQPPVQFDASESWSCVLSPKGTLHAFGFSGFGRLDTPGGNDFTAMACGSYFGVGLRSSGVISHWGSNSQGQASTPTGAPGEFIHLVAAGDFAGAVRPDGTITLWGANGVGQAEFPAGERIRMGDVDCNGDGIADWREIIVDPTLDLDDDGTLDCCQCPGDFDGDGLVDAKDLGLMVSVWGTDGGEVPAADLDGDGDVRAGDLGLVLSLWGACDEPDCP